MKNKQSYKLTPFILVGMARPPQIIQKNNFAKSLQYLKKEVTDKVDFFAQLSITVIYKLILSFLMAVARYVWSTQNNKWQVCSAFAVSQERSELWS